MPFSDPTNAPLCLSPPLTPEHPALQDEYEGTLCTPFQAAARGIYM